jgi:hypothetical protein
MPEPQGETVEFKGGVSEADVRQALDEGKTIANIEDKPAVASVLSRMGATDVRGLDLSEAVDVDLTPEGFETRVSERQFAKQAERQVTEREGVTRGDVVIVGSTEEGFEAVFTEEAQREQRAEQVGQLAEALEGPPEAIFRGFESEEELLRDVEPQDTVTEEEARQQIESQLEQETGVQLDQEDIAFESVEEDGQTVITGDLTREGRKTIEQETAFQGTTQGTPLESISETLAGIKFEYDEFRTEARETIDPNRAERRERFFDTVGLDIDIGPNDIEQAGETIATTATTLKTFGPGDILGETEASRAVEEDLTGGTLPVFSSAAGGGGLATGVRTATAGAATGTAILGGAAAFRGVDRDTPTARTAEITIPESGQFFPQDEMALPDRNGSFVERDEILPPGAQEDLGRTGAPLKEIRPGEGIAPSGVGIGPPVTPTELGLPDAETTGGRGGFGPAQATPVGMQMGEGMLEEEEEEKTLITEEDILDEPITSDPTKNFISRQGPNLGGREAPIQDSAAKSGGYGDVPASDLVSIPIDAPQTVADEEVFVGFGEGETGAVNEEALNRSEAAMRSEVLQGEELLSEINTAQSARQDVGPIGIGEQAARSDAMLESEAMQTGRLDQPLRTQPVERQATVDMPQATPLETPRIDLPAFQYPELPRYEFPTPTLTPPDIPPSERQLRPGLPEGDADTDGDRRRRNALSDLFENIPDDVDAALEGLDFDE